VPISDPTPNETAVYRHPAATRALRTTYDPSVHTVYEGLQNTFRRCASRPFIGERIRLCDGSYGAYKFRTYREIDQLSARVGGQLAKLCPREDVNGVEMASVAIWLRN
jgi:hypothetical protein